MEQYYWAKDICLFVWPANQIQSVWETNNKWMWNTESVSFVANSFKYLEVAISLMHKMSLLKHEIISKILYFGRFEILFKAVHVTDESFGSGT